MAGHKMGISNFKPWTISRQENDHFLLRALTYQESGDMIKLLNSFIEVPRGSFSQPALDKGLLLASRLGNKHIVQGLIEHGAHLETRDERGNTALLNCIELSQNGMAGFLLQKGANVNVTNCNGETPLILATYLPELFEMAKLLLNQPAVNIEHRNKFGYTALMCAINATNIRVMKLLVEAEEFDSVISRQTESFAVTTADQLAAEKGLFEILKLYRHEKRTGVTSLHQAVLNRDIKSVKFLAHYDVTDQELNVCKILSEFIKTLKGPLKDVDYEIVQVLSQRNSCLHEEKASREEVIELAADTGDFRLIQILCCSRFVGSNKALVTAAAKGRCDILRLLIDSGVQVDTLDVNGRIQYLNSPLALAIEKCQFRCASILLERGATCDFSFAIKKVVNNGNKPTLEWMCRKFSSSFREELQSTNLLHVAVTRCDKETVNILLDHGANIDLVIGNMTPLMHAVDPQMIHLLIQRGADVNFKTASFYAKTALTHVFSSSYYDQLRKKWASEMTGEKESIFLVKKLEDIVSAILEHGANVNELDFCDQPLLNLATRKEFSLGLMRLLIDAGADVDAGSFEGLSALQAAVNRTGSIQQVELLIKEGADVNQTDQEGRSPIFSSRDCEITECLIKNGASVNRTDEDGQSPIFISDDCEVTECLIKHGADVNVLDTNGNTALICAVKHFFSKDLFDILIRAGCSIEHKNNRGYSALGLAIRFQAYIAAKYLLHAGTDLNSCLNHANGRSSIDRLLRKMWDDPDSTSEFFHLLLDHKADFSSIIHPCVIHFVIASGCLSLVTKLICSGLGPTDAILQKSGKGWYKFKAGISPLGTALLMENVQLAQYFLEIRYLTKSDIALIFKNDQLFKYLKEHNQLDCLQFIKKISQEPFSLETLSFLAVSSAIGSGPGRHDRIRRSQLPVNLQAQMLYKDATPIATFQDDSDTRSLALFRSFYRNMNGEDYEFCDSGASDSDDFIFYIDDDIFSDSDF